MPDDPDTPTALFERAIANHRAGHLDAAERLYLGTLQDVPDHVGANHNLGILFAQRGRPDLAASHLQKAAEAAPQEAQHWVSYAEALTAAGRCDEARKVLEAARTKSVNRHMIDAALKGIGRPVGEAAGWLRQAIEHHRHGRLEEAIEAYHRVLALRPDMAEVQCNLGSALKAAGRVAEARMAFERAIALAPGLSNAHFNLGNLYREQGAWEAAALSYRAALKANPNFAEAHNNLGSSLLALGKAGDALVYFRRAIELNGNFPSAYNNLGQALRQTGKLDEAKAALETALQLHGCEAEAHNNMGVLLGDGNNFEEAAEHFSHALALKPDYVEAHNNLANLLVKHQGVQGLVAAISHYEAALSLDPGFVEAYDHLGVALCKANRVPEGFMWFTRGAEQRLTQQPCILPAHKRAHDDEQRAYRMLLGLATSGELQIEGGAALSSPAIHRHDQLEQEWRTARPQVIVVDDFLTADALAALRHFCLASTVWNESFEEGYLGARPESGFASPLLAQIADELRAAYPAIFRDYPLLYAWSFKYDSRLKGTQIHADFAAVNVNFWITPDSANLNPNTGGLKVWDVAAPLDWDFARYNRNEVAIRQFLRERSARSIRIPHRANRAVIFDSDLFHETDEMTFADGYENRRINITLLYGDRKMTG